MFKTDQRQRRACLSPPNATATSHESRTDHPSEPVEEHELNESASASKRPRRRSTRSASDHGGPLTLADLLCRPMPPPADAARMHTLKPRGAGGILV